MKHPNLKGLVLIRKTHLQYCKFVYIEPEPSYSGGMNIGKETVIGTNEKYNIEFTELAATWPESIGHHTRTGKVCFPSFRIENS
jgi:hypothetical protein